MKRNVILIMIVLLSFTCCVVENNVRFISQEKFENGLDQTVNVDVLQRIKVDSSITADVMIFSFYFITDKRSKMNSLIDYLKLNEPDQQIVELNKINSIWELSGRTYPINLELDSINKWEKKMWEIGYKFDCELDGWETTNGNLE